MPALERTQEAHAGDGLVVLAVNATNQDSLPAVISFIEEMGLTLPIALDQSGEVGRRYQVRALPTTFFIDRKGVIQEVIVGGPVSESTLLSTVQSLLGEGS
jgi:peroxiredoxin